jgi:hypothetical protein
MVAEVYPDNPRTVVPRIEVGYEDLDPTFHRAVASIAKRQTRGGLRVDGLDPADMEVVREVLRSAEGQRLPVFHYVDQQYLPIGATDPVEPRHSEFEVRGEIEGPNGESSLAIHVPVHSSRVQEYASSPLSLSKKELVGLAAAGLAGDVMAGMGVVLENLPLEAGGVAAVAGVSVYVARRLLRPTTTPQLAL